MGLGPLDLRVESAFTRGDKGLYFQRAMGFNPSSFALTPPTAIYRDNQWLPQVVAGAETSLKYSDQDSVTLGAEYFYNGAGYSDPTLYPTLLTQNAFTFFYVGRHYGALYALLPGPGSWNDTTITLSTLANFSDLSFVSRLGVNQTALTNLQISAYAQYHWGSLGEFRLGGQFLGQTVAPALVDLGVAFILSI